MKSDSRVQLKQWMTDAIRRGLKGRTRRCFATVLAGIVVFTTTYSLILPAITLERHTAAQMPGMTAGQNTEVVRRLNCTVPIHQHDDSCYADVNGERVLICGQADYMIHSHDENCYYADGELVCKLQEREGEPHTHTVACFAGDDGLTAEELGWITLGADGNLVSGDPAHLICGKVEVQEHQHDRDCFEEEIVQVTPDKGALSGQETVSDENVAAEEVENVDASGGNEENLNSEGSGDSSAADVKTGSKADNHRVRRLITQMEYVPDSEKEETTDKETVSGTDAPTVSPEEAVATAGNMTDAEQAGTKYPAVDRIYEGADYQIHVSAEAEAQIPDDAELKVREISRNSTEYLFYSSYTNQTLDCKKSGVVSDRFFDISFYVGSEKVEPKAAVRVEFSFTKAQEIRTDGDLNVVHFKDDGAAELIENAPTITDEGVESISFESASFSVYGVVYTVDFEYEINGKMYEFSLPGGGFVSLTDLVEELGILDGTNFESAADFVAQVKDVEFSSPELVDVSKVDADTTVGQIKESRGLECQYSAELTEEQIKEINVQTVDAGDWALISVQPFDTEESLTVTMKNGDQFVVKVTDAQITTMFLSDSGELYEVTVTYGDDAQIPDGATLKVTEFDEYSQEFQDAWKAITGEDYFSNTNASQEVELEDGELRIATPINTFPSGMEALDITIYDSEGQEVEPKALVSVSIILKSLPEDIGTDELLETAMVNHLIETSDGIVVETVASCDGTTGEMTVLEDSLLAEFVVDSFSMYTISWGAATNSTTNLSIGFRSGNSSRTMTVTVHYVDESGNPITRPSGIGTNTSVTTNQSTTTVTFTDSLLGNGISGYTYKGAHYGTYTGADVTSVTASRNNSTYRVTYYNNESTVGTYTGTTNVYLVYSGTPSGVTVHYGYMNGDTFVEFTEAEDGDVPAGEVFSGPTQYGDQLDLEKTIPGYRYVTTRLNDPVSGRQISSLLNTDPPYVANNNNTFENADSSAYPSYTSSTAPTSFVSNWRYRQLSSIAWNPTGGGWNYSSSEPVTDTGVTKPVSFAETDKDIYVIYEKGSMSAGSSSGGDDLGELDAPATEKDVNPNDDGTYDVSLSVTGSSKSQTEKTKANIVVILDTSWSMYGKDAGNGQSRLSVAKSAIGSLADKLFALNAEESDTIELAFITFAQRVRNEEEMKTIYSGTDATSFKSMINGLDCASGTNWDDALYAANHIYFDDNDPTYVVFITDGDPISCAHPYGTYNDWDGGTYHDESVRTNYQYALAAKNQADLIIANNKTLYTIGAFGEISNLQAIGGTYLGQASDSDTINGYFDDIISDIRNVLGYEDVTIHDGITALTSTALVNGVADQFRYKITKKDGTVQTFNSDAALQAAYSGIGTATYTTSGSEKSVQWDLGTNYQLEDGVTYQLTFTVWPSQEAYDYLADFNNRVKNITAQDASVKKQFFVEVDGSTYQYVENKGWTTDIPAKEGSDYITDTAMQNLINTASSLTHYIRTNTSASVDYTSVKTENGEVTETNTITGAEIRDPNGKMVLDGTALKMQKAWNDSLATNELLELLTKYLNAEGTDTTYSVTLRLWQDKDTADQKEIHTSTSSSGFVIKPTVTIVNGEVTAATWPTLDVSISPGVMVESTAEKEQIYRDTAKYPRVTYGTKTYIILETGHAYNITEDDIDLHFELDADVYYPMVVNGTLKTVKFGVDGEGNRIITEMSPDNTALTTLTATNDLKGGLDVQKFVTTKDDASDTVTTDETFFTFKIKLQKSQTDTTPVYTTEDQFNHDAAGNRTGTISGSLGFRVFAAPVIPSEATEIAADKSSYVFDGLTYSANRNSNGEIISYTARGTIPSSGELTLKIRQSKLGGTDDNLLDRIRIVNMPAGTYYTVEEISVPEGYAIVKTEGSSGTAQANSQVTAKFWNKRTSFTVELLKVDEFDTSKVLADAEFSLFKEDGSTPATDPDGNAIGTIKTGADGKASIGKLLPGTYKLVETVAPKGYIPLSSPITIVVTNEKVTFQQGTKQPTEAAMSSDGLTWTITATNNPGYELPATGGPGTRLFTILGSMLICLAGALLVRRRRLI